MCVPARECVCVVSLSLGTGGNQIISGEKRAINKPESGVSYTHKHTDLCIQIEAGRENGKKDKHTLPNPDKIRKEHS